MANSIFNTNTDTPSEHLTNKEKAEITYKELQKRKLKKERNDVAEFNNYKTNICDKARKRTNPYR